MTLSKEDLLENSKIILINFFQSQYQLLPEASDIAYASACGISKEGGREILNGEYTHSKPAEAQVILQLPADYILLFDSLSELLNAVDNLSVDELIAKYNYTDTFWQQTKFPIETMLKKLSPDYILEKVELSDVYSESEGVISSLKDVISYWFDDTPGSITEIDDDEDDEDYDDEDDTTGNIYGTNARNPAFPPQEAWENQLLYQLREKSSNRVFTQAMSADELPIAVYYLNHPEIKTSPSLIDYSEKAYWNIAATNMATLTVDNADQVESHLNLEKSAKITDKSIDSRLPVDVTDGGLVEDNSYLWTDYRAIGVSTKSGFISNDFGSLEFAYAHSIFQKALDAGLKIYLYFKRENQILKSSIANARDDKDFQNYTVDYNNVNSENEPYFEIRDANDKVIETNIDKHYLCATVIKQLWSNE